MCIRDSTKSLGFEQSPINACVMRLIESGSVSIVTVVHVDDIFAVGVKSGCDQFCEDLRRLVPVNSQSKIAVVCCLPFFEGLGCWYFDDFAASFG